MPCRTWRRGLVTDGLGIVFREAEAAGSPVLVGDSGGAPFVVRNGETGRQVDGHRPRPHAGCAHRNVPGPGRRPRDGGEGTSPGQSGRGLRPTAPTRNWPLRGAGAVAGQRTSL
ncbi:MULTISPECIES: glycosyltransferase [Streptomyces]|uniref:glycosyltransferase n=1 Tax=Streptomyces TaxID=1883 RepID=UPI000DA60B71|nr:glycosyltransferase [Streptomyces sp. SID7805]